MSHTTISHRSEAKLQELRGQFIIRSLLAAAAGGTILSIGGVMVLAFTIGIDGPLLFGAYLAQAVGVAGPAWLIMLNRYDVRAAPPAPAQRPKQREIPVYVQRVTGWADSGVGEDDDDEEV